MKVPSALELQLLAVLSERGALSGRDVARVFKEETRKSISYGALYTTFRRMKVQGWIHIREDSDDDGRIRIFELDHAGKTALREARRYYSRLAEFALAKA